MRRRTRSDVAREPSLLSGTMKEWPLQERPREKLLCHGAPSLTDAELLAIILRTGSGRSNALELAHRLLGTTGTLRDVARRNAPELMRLNGIGRAKAVEILATFEISRRLQMHRDEGRVPVRTPEDVARVLIPRLRDLTYESFVVFVLDANNIVKAESELSRGILNASLVHPREVFKLAIDHVGAAVIVAHNHPSGNAEPSREDIEITRQLVDAGKVVGIPLHDHLIIAGNGFTSLAERGYV